MVGPQGAGHRQVDHRDIGQRRGVELRVQFGHGHGLDELDIIVELLEFGLDALDDEAMVVGDQYSHADPGTPFRGGWLDRKSVGSGKSVSVRVDFGGRRNIKNKHKTTLRETKLKYITG